MVSKKKIPWKQKSMYKIIAPEIFDSGEIGVTMANSPDSLIGRTIDVSLKDLTGDKSKQHLKVLFEIEKVNAEGKKAKTRFKEFYLNPSYIKSKVKKGISKIEYAKNLDLSDNVKAWMNVVLITHSTIQTSKVKDISSITSKILDKYKKSTLNEFLQLALFGKIGTEIYNKVKKVTPIKRVEVERIKIL